MKHFLRMLALVASAYVVFVGSMAISNRTGPSWGPRDWCPIVCRDLNTSWSYTKLPFGRERTLWIDAEVSK